MRTIILTVIILLLAGCETEPRRPDQPVDPEAKISRMLAAGEYQLAAEELIQLARLTPVNAVSYQHRAAEIYISSGDLYTAKAVLENIKTDEADEIFYNRLLAATIALEENRPVEALTLLNIKPPVDTPNSLIIKYYDIRIQAFSLQENIIDATAARIDLSKFLETEDEQTHNSSQIWTALNKLDIELLKQYRLSSPPVLASWLELAIINQTLFFKPDQLELSISLWKEQYPDHPANSVIVDEILFAGRKIDVRPGHIALCLPFSGPYEWASHAIRDGFLAAWFAATDYKPDVRIYDGDALNIVDVFQRAIDNGADLIVGPLEKNAIVNLLAHEKITVTTLALNQVDTALLERTLPVPDSQIPVLIQFSLSPEDEASQVAARANSDGYKRALVITPNNDRGQRLFDAFNSQWSDSGGIVVEHIKYPENTEEFRTWVKSLLNVNSSDKRIADLRNRLNRNLESETRLRSDADVIFLAATPVTARRIVPEFRFYQAGIPVYSTSDIHTGIYNPAQDRDLDGVVFNNIPWILDAERQASALQQDLNKHWSAAQSEYRKLYALGIDAYQLIPHLGRLMVQNTVHYPGETGDLFLTEGGYIQRKLMWAKFSQGKPVVLE